MRCPKRRRRTSPLPRSQQSSDRPDARDLERLVERERRQDARAGAGRASTSRCPAAPRAGGCGRRPPRARARGGRAPGRGRRQGRGSAGGAGSARRRRRTARCRARREGTSAASREVADRDRLDPAERCLGRDFGGAEDAFRPRSAAPPRPRARCRSTGRIDPSSPISPTAAWPATLSGETCLDAARSASAIGQVETGPFLAKRRRREVDRQASGRPLEPGRANPALTRSFASWQARSPRPTSTNAGCWPRTCASTSTRRASRPTTACVRTRASTLRR